MYSVLVACMHSHTLARYTIENFLIWCMNRPGMIDIIIYRWHDFGWNVSRGTVMECRPRSLTLYFLWWNVSQGHWRYISCDEMFAKVIHDIFLVMKCQPRSLTLYFLWWNVSKGHWRYISCDEISAKVIDDIFLVMKCQPRSLTLYFLWVSRPHTSAWASNTRIFDTASTLSHGTAGGRWVSRTPPVRRPYQGHWCYIYCDEMSAKVIDGIFIVVTCGLYLFSLVQDWITKAVQLLFQYLTRLAL